MIYMQTFTSGRGEQVDRTIAERGPYYAVTGQIRTDQHFVHLCATAERAEAIKAEAQTNSPYAVRIYSPKGVVPLAPIGKQLAAARSKVDQIILLAQAAALRAHEEGKPETLIASELGVDRMTVRKWLGKR
ncbi:hypothetical protein KIH74_22785 [Kineosporia sp. J2-2]|uniref:Helix-turn-helix DNA binding domain protein n=1 Tax=Kineosporia corallincola TaxID=2835133 RepID=A0ABS5TL07_9ACTN|nr:hypothetical protein [Kineosporia corallincola]MBT0771785.1 hypothetical protein [Kineosporia corallincola]